MTTTQRRVGMTSLVMDTLCTNRVEDPGLRCHYVAPGRPLATLVDDVRAGLLTRPRWLSPKYFYDERGSRLFDAICDTPEYYPTRTENRLLADCARAVVATARPDHIVELGSGTSRKTRRLFDACAQLDCPANYWPFDVCEEIVRTAAAELSTEYDWLQIRGLVGDYTGGLANLPQREGANLFVFLGSTIGNFEPSAARAFLSEVRASMGPRDMLLLGADRVKDERLLNAAYNDADGLTALFNLNLLHVLNRELQADFDPDGFVHRAYFNNELSRIEMHLQSRRAQRVSVAGLGESLEFGRGETVLTEISRKFTPQALAAMLRASGFNLRSHFEPEDGAFSLVLAAPAE